MAVGKPASKGSRAEAKERLLVQAAQKDPSRFAELYEDNFERIYAYIVHRVRDRNGRGSDVRRISQGAGPPAQL